MVVIALDIGGSKIAGALVTEKYKLLHVSKAQTPASSGKVAILALIEKTISHLLEQSSKKVVAISISMPGFTDDKGVISFAGTVLADLVGVPLHDRLKKKFDLPIFIENDALCFTLAESLFGAGKNIFTVAGIIWGTGIGSALIMKPRKGKVPFLMDSRMELGHIPLFNTQSHRMSTLEHLAGGHFIMKRYQQRGGKLRHISVADIYSSKEPAAKAVMKEAIEYLAQGLSIVVNTLHPEIIIIGGGVSQLPDSVYKQLTKLVKKYALPTHTKNLHIVRYGISADAGLFGAAALVYGGK